MSARRVTMTAEEAERYLAAYRAHGEVILHAAEALGMNEATLRRRLKQARALAGEGIGFDPPDLPAADVPFEDEIVRLSDTFQRQHGAAMARHWMPFKIKTDGPFALAFVGDPHIDDNGCNWPLLRRDVDILRRTNAMWGVGMGDYTNNWAGKLQRIYADQDMTRTRAWQAAAWFFKQPFWMLLIKGNHDLWSGTADPLDWIARGPAVLENWQSRFKVVSPNGRSFRIWAAHAFPGSSQWNPLHGAGKAARFSGSADIYVQGHHHEWAMTQMEDPHRAAIFWALKTRGYKFIDSYAEDHGFFPQQHGATVAAIFDPDVQGPASIQCFGDLEEASDLLSWKRARFAQGRRAAA
jgi:hypothetical protein